SATATIVGDDSGIAIAAAQASAFEGNQASTPFTFTVTRSGATADPLAVSWSVFGWGVAAANAADFSGAAMPWGVATFKPGETTKTISIGVVGDADPEADEAFLVKITAAGNAKILAGSASSTILTDDTAVALKSVTVTKPEGQTGSTAYAFQAIRTGRTDTACSARWTVAGVGPLAADAADFTGGQLPSGTVSFAAGETTAVVSVSVAGDVVAEADEQFSVTLSDPVNAAVVAGVGRGLIRNDDTSVAVGPAVVSRAEGRSGSTSFVFGVTRTGLSTAAVTVAWNVTGLGASPATGDDFLGGTLPSGTVTLQPGQTSARIVVLVAGDTVAEDDEGFAVTLSNAGDASIVRAVSEGSITNDDAPAPSLSATALAFAALAEEKPAGRAKIFV
ncbi:MAG: Calx-beta domain-containing protein, partial [Planctomycetia bacterium]